MNGPMMDHARQSVTMHHVDQENKDNCELVLMEHWTNVQMTIDTKYFLVAFLIVPKNLENGLTKASVSQRATMKLVDQDKKGKLESA